VRSRRAAIATRPTSADVEFRRPLVTRDGITKVIAKRMENDSAICEFARVTNRKMLCSQQLVNSERPLMLSRGDIRPNLLYFSRRRRPRPSPRCRLMEIDPRCPPTAEAPLYGVLLLQKKIQRTGTIEC
jgi:hypothetical protein